MSEKPIPFITPMVEAVLDNRKTQTRRVVTALRRHGRRITEFGRSDTPGYDWHFRDKAMRWHDISHARVLELCPYQPGDVLWVRETWANLAYDCDEPMITFKAGTPSTDEPGWALPPGCKWRPGMFLRRVHARLFLRVTAVRVERLQEISEADARAEGVIDGGCLSCGESEPCGCDDPLPDARDTFACLWDSLNAHRHPWSSNCWVWVVEFERCR